MSLFIAAETLLQISEQAPRSLVAYLILKNNANEDGHVLLTKKRVTHDLSLSWTKFNNDLRALCRLGLLEWHLHRDGHLTITLAEDSSHGDSQEFVSL